MENVVITENVINIVRMLTRMCSRVLTRMFSKHQEVIYIWRRPLKAAVAYLYRRSAFLYSANSPITRLISV